MSGKVVARCAWTCVRETREDGLRYFEIWRYSKALNRWARHERYVGYGDLMDAIRDAKEISDTLLRETGFIPPPLTIANGMRLSA